MALDTKNLSVTTQVAIGVVIVVVTFALAYYLAPAEFQKKAERITQLEESLEQKKQEIRKGKTAVASLEELQREIGGLERKLADLKQILPTAPEMGDLLKWIKSLSDQTNLELQIFKPETVADQEFLREQPVTMAVHGNYHQLGLFFDRVSKYARIINVENVRIAAQRDEKITIRADFVAKTYMFKEEPPAEGGTAAPGGGA